MISTNLIVMVLYRVQYVSWTDLVSCRARLQYWSFMSFDFLHA